MLSGVLRLSRTSLKSENLFRSSFAYFSFKKSRLTAAAVVTTGAIGSVAGAATVVTAETAVRAEEQKCEDYDPEALVVLE